MNISKFYNIIFENSFLLKILPNRFYVKNVRKLIFNNSILSFLKDSNLYFWKNFSYFHILLGII
ncbi:hypothetical protein B2G50_02040 [Leptospira interrogans serovar Canicola]|nr:hypothetical protein B2G50_02040 [Leptospira interrogans serovar Canicola]